jgi:uroporphyrinogen-III synthase
MSFAGLRVVAFESRRAAEMAQLVRKQEGEPFVAPSMREVPLERNEEVFRFAERLFAGEFDMAIFLTGVGTRLLGSAIETRHPREKFIEALRGIAVAARGPKPAAVLREWQVPIAVMAPEPNTWRELLAAMEGRPERRIALQEYGRSNPELIAGLRARGAEVTPVPVYQWDLPEDTGPLREAVARLARGEVDVAVFTTGVQAVHLFRIAAETGAEDAVRTGLERAVVASIGPTTSESLEDYGVHPDLEPSHPRMGILIGETAARAAALLRNKRPV